MLPHNNNYYSYQGTPNRGNLTFDVKVNVDLNSGKVNLGVPAPAPPFIKKPDIPVVYGDPVLVVPHGSYQSGYSAPYQVNQPTLHQVPQMWQPTPNHNTITQPYHPSYNPQHIEQSYIMRYSDNQKPKSANDTYPDTSFSMGIQKSLEAVQCVICDKPISREHFHAHIEEHKARKRDYTKKQTKEPQNNGGSFSVKNQNSFQNAAELYNQNLSKASVSRQTLEKVSLKLDQSKNISKSRQIQNTHSRIVYAPRDPSQILSAGNQSEFTYSHSSDFNNKNKETYQLVQKQSSRSLSQNKQSIQNYFQQNSRSSSAPRDNQFQNKFSQKSNNNYFNRDKTQSRIIKPDQKKKQASFEDIQQSVIHRINDLSRDYSIIQLKKQLNIEEIQEEESSDDEQEYLSVKGHPPSNAYQNFSKSKHSYGISSSSNMTQKLTRSKLPVNYLARQDFIINSMITKSCYKSRHSSWK